MCTVTAAVIGVISGGLSIAQQYQAVAAQNAQIKHANAQAQQNYQFQLLQNQANRTHENQKQILQDDMMLQTRFFADANHENNIAQLNTQLLQEQAATAAKKRKANREALQLMGQVRSAGRVGNTVDTLLADYRRQKEFFDYIDKNWKGDHEEVDVHSTYKVDGRRKNFREKMRKLGYIKAAG